MAKGLMFPVNNTLITHINHIDQLNISIIMKTIIIDICKAPTLRLKAPNKH